MFNKARVVESLEKNRYIDGVWPRFSLFTTKCPIDLFFGILIAYLSRIPSIFDLQDSGILFFRSVCFHFPGPRKQCMLVRRVYASTLPPFYYSILLPSFPLKMER